MCATRTDNAPLSQVFLATADCVLGVMQGRSLTELLGEVDSALRPGTQALAFHAVREMGWSHALLVRLIAREPILEVQALLQSVLPLLGSPADRDSAPHYAAHTVVDQAVQAAENHPALRALKPLINGVLRRFLREREALEAEIAKDPEARWNHPEWWQKKLRGAYPHQWQTLLETANLPAPMTLRVNRRRASVDQVRQVLADAGVQSEPVGPAGLVLAQARSVQRLPGFAEGWWSVQDLGAQRAAPLVNPKPGMRVLDACAAPGGKTAHLLELADIELVALDADARRLERVGENLDRLGLRHSGVSLQCADAAQPDQWWDGRPFDVVLADVPCTASGIVRRHPDIRWLRREADITRTATVQAAIAAALWRVLAPGGVLVYATCSLFVEEGARQAQRFVDRHPDARALEAPGQILPRSGLVPGEAPTDGFFYARFAKSA